MDIFCYLVGSYELASIILQYDFSLESKVIEWTENNRKAQEAVELAKKEQEKLAAAEAARKAEEDAAENNGKFGYVV